MSDKVNYSIVNTEQGNISVRSTVKSFNLDHVTEKDIVSFYNHFSTFSAWDTGLLPVEGSGILSIRTAGIYTQFAYQHKPGLYHVNWSKNEGGLATAYYVAQPYRIIICDMKEGNLLGARMFYSPYPITSPTQPLYHVNLPNTNCKGYRNNGVGWQCLYQNEDWSHLPLNERIVRFIERCSGVETYNDDNMSETDGIRFYRENGKPEYLWSPFLWEEKSKEGYEWTLDESLWIPVLVKDKDDQKAHDSNGNPLTFADAVVGDYRAYYYDDQHTKPINAVIRPDRELSASDIMSYFVSAYTAANAQSPHILHNTFEASQKIKDQKGSAEFKGSSLLNAPDAHNNSHDDDEDDENIFYCESCENDIHIEEQCTDAYGNYVCSDCLSQNYIYIKSADAYYATEDSNISYSEHLSEHFHEHFDSIAVCDCDETYGVSGLNKHVPYVFYNENEGEKYCVSCVETYANDLDLQVSHCYSCTISFINEPGFNKDFINTLIATPKYVFDDEGNQIDTTIENTSVAICKSCSISYMICPCGYLKNAFSTEINAGIDHTVHLENDSIDFKACCAECTIVDFNDAAPAIKFNPKNSNYKEYHIQLDKLKLSSKIHLQAQKPDNDPF